MSTCFDVPEIAPLSRATNFQMVQQVTVEARVVSGRPVTQRNCHCKVPSHWHMTWKKPTYEEEWQSKPFAQNKRNRGHNLQLRWTQGVSVWHCPKHCVTLLLRGSLDKDPDWFGSIAHDNHVVGSFLVVSSGTVANRVQVSAYHASHNKAVPNNSGPLEGAEPEKMIYTQLQDAPHTTGIAARNHSKFSPANCAFLIHTLLLDFTNGESQHPCQLGFFP